MSTEFKFKDGDVVRYLGGDPNGYGMDGLAVGYEYAVRYVYGVPTIMLDEFNWMVVSDNHNEHCFELVDNEESDTVTISRSQYEVFQHDSEWVRCLEAAGVDNWSGIDYAYELLGDSDDE